MNELPTGWTWASISAVTRGVPNINPQTKPDECFGYVDISAIDNSNHTITETKNILGAEAPSRAKRPINGNDVLFSNVRTYLRNIAIVPVNTEAQVCSTGFTVLRSNEAIDPRYLFRWVLTDSFVRHVTPQQTGTHYPATSDRVVKAELIPLAPLNEQRRIVAKLEKLLSRVDAVNARLATIPRIVKRFRQSVLAAACSGRLTADWRETNTDVEPAAKLLERIKADRRALWEQVELRKKQVKGDSPKENSWRKKYKEPTLTEDLEPNGLPPFWEWERLDSALAYIEPGKSFKCLERPPLKDEVGVLKVSALSWGEFDERESKTCKDSKLINPDIQVNAGDFLFSRANTIELVGACVIADKVVSKVMLSDKTLRLHIAGLVHKYVLYALRSSVGRAEIERLATGNQNSMRNIGQERIREILIPVPPLAEQQEIVRRVEALFKTADALEARYLKAKAYVDKLTQSILAKAFRGELVPQDPNDEPASVLLERTRKSDTVQEPRSKREAGTKQPSLRRAKAR